MAVAAEPLGSREGEMPLDDVPFEGPKTNGLIGIGSGAFRRSRPTGASWDEAVGGPTVGLGRTPETASCLGGFGDEPLTAVGLVVRTLSGEDPATNPAMRWGAARCLDRLPRWDPLAGTTDPTYWLHASIFFDRARGPDGERWRAEMERVALAAQRRDGRSCEAFGSWDPAGPWADVGGRVHTTATMALCIAIPGRHAGWPDPMPPLSPPDPAVDTSQPH